MSIYGITLNGVRIGTVMKFMGEPKERRWIAYAPGERREGFPTRDKASAWLVQVAEEDAKNGPRLPT